MILLSFISCVAVNNNTTFYSFTQRVKVEKYIKFLIHHQIKSEYFMSSSIFFCTFSFVSFTSRHQHNPLLKNRLTKYDDLHKLLSNIYVITYRDMESRS